MFLLLCCQTFPSSVVLLQIGFPWLWWVRRHLLAAPALRLQFDVAGWWCGVGCGQLVNIDKGISGKLIINRVKCSIFYNIKLDFWYIF